MANLTTYERHFAAIKVIATTSAIGLVVASAGFGVVFAYRVGIEHSMFLACISVLMALALEGIKPIAVAFAFRAFQSFQLVRGSCLALLGGFAIAYSLTSELTLVAMSRGDLTAKREAAISLSRVTDQTYEQAKNELDTLGDVRTAGEIQAEITNIDRLPGILINGGPCGGVHDGPTTKKYCPRRSQLLAELARTTRRKELQSITNTYVTNRRTQTQHIKTADPGSFALSTYLSSLGVSIPVATIPS